MQVRSKPSFGYVRKSAWQQISENRLKLRERAQAYLGQTQALASALTSAQTGTSASQTELSIKGAVNRILARKSA
jgi:hypothetical protein